MCREPVRAVAPVITAVVLLLSLGGEARADFMLIGNDFLGNLFDVNQATGAVTNPRSTGISAFIGLTVSPSGTLYTISPAGSTPAGNALFTINPATGASSLVGSTGLSNILEGDLAFDRTAGVIYGVYNSAGTNNEQLFRVNPATGAATVVGTIPGANDPSALAFDSSGNLFELDTQINSTNNSTLSRLDKNTGAVLSTVTLSAKLGAIAGLAFDPTTGTLYAASGNFVSNLYTVNTTTGALTLVGPTTGSPNGLAGLAFLPTGTTTAVPEPPGLALLGVGAAGLAGWRWRRRAG